MTRTVQEVFLGHLTPGMAGSISVPAGAELLTAKLDQFDQPVVLALGNFSIPPEPRAILLVGSHQYLPDAYLRWVGSFVRPGWGQEMHVFEVLS